MSGKAITWLILAISVASYSLLQIPFAGYMKSRPVVEKLGYVPSIKLLKPLSLDHKELTAASLVMKVMIYYGGVIEKQNANVIAIPPDFQGMSRMLHGSVKLDPYNMDAYYFAQSFLTWDVMQFKIANDLLEYGMMYRAWDWYLPYFCGFNNAYFLKDLRTAAVYYRRAAELSGNPLFVGLAGRYLQETGQTQMAIDYLKAMIAVSREPSLIKSFEVRLKAFQAVHRIEVARDAFVKAYGKLPADIDKLVAPGYLDMLPIDPYGGKFYLESNGAVRTTSRYAYAAKDH